MFVSLPTPPADDDDYDNDDDEDDDDDKVLDRDCGLIMVFLLGFQTSMLLNPKFADDDHVGDDIDAVIVDDFDCDVGNYCTFPLMTWMLFMKPA